MLVPRVFTTTSRECGVRGGREHQCCHSTPVRADTHFIFCSRDPCLTQSGGNDGSYTKDKQTTDKAAPTTRYLGRG